MKFFFPPWFIVRPRESVSKILLVYHFVNIPVFKYSWAKSYTFSYAHATFLMIPIVHSLLFKTTISPVEADKWRLLFFKSLGVHNFLGYTNIELRRFVELLLGGTLWGDKE